MKIYSITIMVIAFFINCKTSDAQWRKLSYNEMYERAEYGIYYNPENIIYKDTLGNIIDHTQLNRFSRDSFAVDEYVNQNDSVKLCIIRKITQKDIELREKISKLYSENVELQIKRINATVKDSLTRIKMIEYAKLNSPIKPININCDSISLILKNTLLSDQENRSKNEINLHIDRENQIKVVSIIENCGFPTIEIAGEEGIYSIFMVIQHANKEMRQKYMPYLQASAERGELKKSALALMEDRMLIDYGQKQKYGSQLRFNNEAGQWELYPIENVNEVDKRRFEVGLEPLSDYLKRFNGKFDSKVLENKN